MILKDKKLSDIPTATNIDEKGNTIIENWDDINSKAGREKQHLINRIAAQFGAFKEYSNSDIELDFEFSKNNFRESYNKQGKNFDDFAKMFSVFDRVIDNAVGIEVHNRNAHGYKIDRTLENVYVMVSAFKDGDSLVPVKLEIKQFSDKPNKLYVAITSDKIKMTEVWKQGNTDNGVTQNSRSVNISISYLFKKINSENKGLYKYIPLPFKQTQSDIKLREKLNDFRDGFESIKKEDTQYAVISDLYNDFISEQIVELKNTVGGKTIKELSVSELEKIDKLVKMTAQSINNINRLFLKERNAAAQQYANKVGQELKPLRREKVFNNSVKSLMFNSLKPEYFFQYIGSDTLLELYHDLRKGEDIWAVDVSQAREFALEIRKKYGWHNWDNKTKRKFNSVDGEIELTLQERLGIYANSLGEHTKNHLLGGGFTYQKSKYDTIKKKFTRDYNDNGSHRLSEADISDTWTHIWNAVKAETKAKYPELSDNSEQLLKKAGERFTQVITKCRAKSSVRKSWLFSSEAKAAR